jgi:hypothetical protein
MAYEEPRLSWEQMLLKAQISPAKAKEFAQALTFKWSDDDFRSLPGWCAEIGCDPTDLLLVMTSESRLRTDALNPKKGLPLAAGLNQMTRVALQAIGRLPKDDDEAKNAYPGAAKEIASMNVSQQFKALVIPFFAKTRESYSGPWTATSLYMANAASSKMYLANNPKAVLYTKGDGGYEGNPGLDTNRDGKITTSDLTSAVEYHRSTPEFVAAKYRYIVVALGGDSPDAPWWLKSWG